MSRDRLTITLDEALLSAVDGTIDGSAVRNRSHAIEHLIRQGLHLHELTHVIMLAGNPTDEPIVPLLAERLKTTNIIQGVIISDPEHPQWALGLRISLQTLIPTLHTRVIPGDFGSAAALTLLKEDLLHPFLLVELGEGTQFPTSFLPLYTEHRHSDKTMTQLLATDDGLRFTPTGCSIASPELITQIPAGHANLQDVFPLLAKAGRVGTYVE
jgi:hypothetical protein